MAVLHLRLSRFQEATLRLVSLRLIESMFGNGIGGASVSINDPLGALKQSPNFREGNHTDCAACGIMTQQVGLRD